MSINESTLPSFGRLNWDINKEFSTTIRDIYLWFSYVGIFFEIIAIIFFIVKFCVKKSNFQTSYFVIFTIGLVSDAITKCFSFGYRFTNLVPLYYISAPLQWYQGNLNTMWNTILALNRLTAIVFFLHYNQIWTKRNTGMMCSLLLIYPFLINLYKPPKLLCNVLGYLCPTSIRLSYSVTSFDNFFLTTHDCICAIIATILCSIAVIRQKLRKKNSQIKIQQMDLVLLIQSLLSSSFLVLSAVFSLLSVLNGPPENATRGPETTRIANLQLALSYISDLFYAFYHYSSLVVMFTFSGMFRRDLMKFYKITKVIHFVKKHMPKPAAVSVAAMRTAGVNPMTRIV